MSDSGIVRELSHTDKPMCPNVTSGLMNEAHAIHVKTLNAFYNAAQKDENGELKNQDTENAYTAASYTVVNNKMDLYFARVSWFTGSSFRAVETYWFQCHICGLVLPAYEKLK